MITLSNAEKRLLIELLRTVQTSDELGMSFSPSDIPLVRNAIVKQIILMDDEQAAGAKKGKEGAS